MTRIAVDAMGGDYAPSEIVKGAVWAAHDYKVPIELVGKEDVIREELDRIAKIDTDFCDKPRKAQRIKTILIED